MELTHINSNGEAIMVNVGDKEVTNRTAIAQAVIVMNKETMDLIMSSNLKKGDAISTARIAGIMAAKHTSDLIPLCHNIPIDSVEINFEKISDTELKIISSAKCTYKTGIEMEALTAVSISALTIYDMCKAVDRKMKIQEIKLIEKTGGKSDFYD